MKTSTCALHVTPEAALQDVPRDIRGVMIAEHHQEILKGTIVLGHTIVTADHPIIIVHVTTKPTLQSGDDHRWQMAHEGVPLLRPIQEEATMRVKDKLDLPQ
jgi:hypothetical protein